MSSARIIEAFDVDAYCARIRFTPTGGPDLALLRALQEAHLAHVAFENIDVILRRPIRIDLASIQQKLIYARRGGYCYEQNGLFAAALAAFGFHVQTLEARVRMGASRVLGRTHMTLRVDMDGRAWLSDVGFGCDGPLYPVPLDGEVQEQPGGAFATGQEADDVHVLRSRSGGEWCDLYAFRLTPALPVDYELANYYTSTHPQSRFVNTLTAQLTTAQARHVLRGRTYIVTRDSGMETREVSEAEVGELLRGVFGLEVNAEELRALRAT